MGVKNKGVRGQKKKESLSMGILFCSCWFLIAFFLICRLLNFYRILCFLIYRIFCGNGPESEGLPPLGTPVDQYRGLFISVWGRGNSRILSHTR